MEIEALLEETERARVHAAQGTQGVKQVMVNEKVIPTQPDGSFRAVVDPTRNRGRVHVGIRAEDGSVAATTVALPTIRILEPTSGMKVEIGEREKVIKLMKLSAAGGEVQYPTVKIPVKGQTEPGNQVIIDGEPVTVKANGIFKTRLPLAVGENTFGVVAMAPNGYTSLLNLSVNLTGVDDKSRLIIVRDPQPPVILELPPRGAVLPDPNLFISGQVSPKASVTVNQKWHMAVLPNGTFGGTVRLPEGPSVLQVTVVLPNGSRSQVGVPVEVRSNYFFLVALGDATVNQISTEGPVPEMFRDDLFVDGRLAFYLRGRVRGKYLIKAGLDTGDGEASDIGSRLNDRDNRDFFRNLDPDSFYPVYGDASRTYRDANSQGRFFALVESENARYEWGNYSSGITGNEFSSFNRSLYGGKGSWQSLKKREDGEPLGQVMVFAALPETRSAHDEFLGTGGSLFYLRHQNVILGSEKVRLEVRDQVTGIPVANVTLRNYVDYEIDYRDGRILFRTPVQSVAATSLIISDQLLNGNSLIVMVDYEFDDPSASLDEDTTYGARVKKTVGKYLTVGGTYVQEDRAGATYKLEGGDLTVRAGGNTQITAEFSQSRNEAVPQYLSTDGGLTFNQKTVPATDDTAQAYRLEFATGNGPARVTGYFRHIDQGFSSAYQASEFETDQYGGTLEFKFGENASLNLLFDEFELKGTSTRRTGTLQYRQKIGKFGWTAEARYRDVENQLLPDTTEGIGAIRFDFRPQPKLDFFVRYQDDFMQEV
ncbi:MAG: hypothetical protein V3T54_03265, partial [Acidobacteriota bacterium]